MSNANLKKQHRQKLLKIEQFMSQENRKGDLRRARSVTVGTAFGGTTEIMMRNNDGNVVWAIMQPVEVVELIHQLAANVGCHLQLIPRKDFASWRDWKYTEAELAWFRGFQPLPGVGHPPHSNDISPFLAVGANIPAPEQQPGLQPAMMARSKENETVAIEKPKNRRSTKRASKAA